jgi:hypothetical protein
VDLEQLLRGGGGDRRDARLRRVAGRDDDVPGAPRRRVGRDPEAAAGAPDRHYLDLLAHRRAERAGVGVEVLDEVAAPSEAVGVGVRRTAV